jgi:anti-anti-sigma regulatory factor
MPDFGIDPVSIDVGHLVRRNVASLYSSLVTRPTGKAVRLAIENVVAEEVGRVSLSIIDLSQVTVIDFSCADEVVAKLLLRYLKKERPKDAFFVFRGIKELHRDTIEVVLERQSLIAVAESDTGSYQLIGAASWAEEEAWRVLERMGVVAEADVGGIAPDPEAREALDSLVERRVVFHSPSSREYRALSSLMRDLA